MKIRKSTRHHSTPRASMNSTTRLVLFQASDLKSICKELNLNPKCDPQSEPNLFQEVAERIDDAIDDFRMFQPLQWRTPPGKMKTWASSIRKHCDGIISNFETDSSADNDVSIQVILALMQGIPSRRVDSGQPSTAANADWQKLDFHGYMAKLHSHPGEMDFRNAIIRAVKAVVFLRHAADIAGKNFASNKIESGESHNKAIRKKLIRKIADCYFRFTGNAPKMTRNGPTEKFIATVLKLVGKRILEKKSREVPMWNREKFDLETGGKDAERIGRLLVQAATTNPILEALRKYESKVTG